MRANNGHLRKKNVVLPIEELIFASAVAYDMGFRDGKSTKGYSICADTDFLTKMAISPARGMHDCSPLRNLGGERSGICRRKE